MISLGGSRSGERESAMNILAWPGTGAKMPNPYTQLLYSHIERLRDDIVVGEFTPTSLITPRSRWDVWHMHWPEDFLNSTRGIGLAVRLIGLVMLVAIAKLRGTRLVWTIHQLDSHDPRHPRLERIVKRLIVAGLDGAIALTEGSAAQARERFPALRNRPIAVVPHGHYMDVYPRDVSRREARRRLGLENRHRVVLFIGAIKPYKNVPSLIRTFARVRGEDLRLVVAGEPSSEALRAEVISAAANDDRVQLHLNLVKDEDLQVFLGAADLVVLPFRGIMNSGSVFLALSFGRPVLVPDKGAMRELRSILGPAFISIYDGEIEPASIERALNSLPDRQAERDLAETLRRTCGWSEIAERTLAFYESLVRA